MVVLSVHSGLYGDRERRCGVPDREAIGSSRRTAGTDGAASPQHQRASSSAESFPVPEDERLAEVSEEVGKDEDVHLIPDVVEGILGDAGVVDEAVASVVLLRDRLSEVFVDILEELPEEAQV